MESAELISNAEKPKDESACTQELVMTPSTHSSVKSGTGSANGLAGLASGGTAGTGEHVLAILPHSIHVFYSPRLLMNVIVG